MNWIDTLVKIIKESKERASVYFHLPYDFSAKTVEEFMKKTIHYKFFNFFPNAYVKLKSENDLTFKFVDNNSNDYDVMIKLERVDTLESLEFSTWSNDPEEERYIHIVERWYDELKKDGANSFHWIKRGVWWFFKSVAGGAKKYICFTVKRVIYSVCIPKLGFYEIAGESTIPIFMMHALRDEPPWFPGGIEYTWSEIRSDFTYGGDYNYALLRNWYVYAFCSKEWECEGYTIMRAQPLLKIFVDCFAKIVETLTASYNPFLHEIEVSVGLNGFDSSYFPAYSYGYKVELRFKREFAELYNKLKQLPIM